jgi:F-type H+-transporting ATPase subunit delta
VTGSLGRRYARALLALARESGALAEAGEQLERATATFAEPELRAVVLNPAIAMTVRREVVGAIADRLGLSSIVGNLIRLLADRDRLSVLPDVVRAYGDLVDRELGRAPVTFRSAAAFTAGQLAELERVARRLTGREHLVVSTQVDPELIGGVVVDAGGTVYDGSVKTQLARIAGRMAGTSA